MKPSPRRWRPVIRSGSRIRLFTDLDHNRFIAQSSYGLTLIQMCLAIPAKIIAQNGNLAQVDFGTAVLREVNVSLVKAKVGDYVLVHAGYAIQVLDGQEALETLRLWNEILQTEA